VAKEDLAQKPRKMTNNRAKLPPKRSKTTKNAVLSSTGFK
jgi:hypothetical protein